MTGRAFPRASLTVAALLAPAVARAHLVSTGLGPFYDGVSHLALTPEDLLPALALSLLAGRRGAAPGRAALLALPAAWLLGGLAGIGWPTAGTPALLAPTSLLVTGALVAAEARLRPSAVIALASILGLVHGYLNGSAMARAGLGGLGLAGIVVSVAVLVALAAALGVTARASWARVAVRVAGSWIAAVGLLSLGWTMRPG